MQTKEFAVTTWAITMPVLVGILKQFLRILLLFGEGWGQGEKGGVRYKVLSTSILKDLIVVAKRFILIIIMF